MINRYLIPEINEIWSDKNKYNVWLKVEQLICHAWSKLDVIDKQDLKDIDSLKVNIQRMLELEEETKHDVVAFTRMLSEQIGIASRWIHLGVTSTDIVDTAQNFLIKDSNKIIFDLLEIISISLKEKALEYKDQMIMGRTHGMFGEPTSLGLKFLLWYEEFERHKTRLELANKQICVAKISGSMGNYANLEIEIEQYVAKKLDLEIDNISTQVTQRDRHSFLLEVFGLISSTLEKISTEIRLFQRSDVNEWAEGFAKNQKGSSSMPHKKNPISSENIVGLSRMIKSYISIGLDNNNLWHERDISHSSNERIMFPDVFNLLAYSLKRMNNVLNELVINKTEIEKNIIKSKNIFFSQRVMTFIIMKNKTLTREEVYDYVQTITLNCQLNKTDFKDEVLKSDLIKHIDKKDLESIFDINFFNRQTDKIFSRILKK